MLMNSHFCQSKPLTVVSVGDFLKPSLEVVKDCVMPVRIYVRWLNAYMPFACGRCTVCQSNKSKR